MPSEPEIEEGAAYEAIQQYNWFLGASLGNLGYNFDTETFSLSIRPRFGYFISDNALLGIEPELGLVAFDGGEAWTYGITPFARYYFPEGSGPNGRIFAEAILGFAGSSLEGSDEDSGLSVVYGLRAGYAYFITNSVGVEATFGYTFSDADVFVGNARTGLNLAFGFGIYLHSKRNQ